MIYLGGQASFALDMAKIAGGRRVAAFWIDPRTGEQAAIDRLSTAGVESFSTPAGWEDALLTLEASVG